MIEIVNITRPDRLQRLIHNYELRVNGFVLAKFLHKPGDGMAKCLRIAAATFEALDRLEKESRFPDEKDQAPEKDPDEEGGLHEEELLQAQAAEVEAGLVQKEGMAGGLPGAEEITRTITDLWRMSGRDPDRLQCFLASSQGTTNTGSLADDYPGLRDPMPPVDSCPAVRSDGPGATSSGLPEEPRCVHVTGLEYWPHEGYMPVFYPQHPYKNREPLDFCYCPTCGKGLTKPASAHHHGDGEAEHGGGNQPAVLDEEADRCEDDRHDGEDQRNTHPQQ